MFCANRMACGLSFYLIRSRTRFRLQTDRVYPFWRVAFFFVRWILMFFVALRWCRLIFVGIWSYIMDFHGCLRFFVGFSWVVGGFSAQFLGYGEICHMFFLLFCLYFKSTRIWYCRYCGGIWCTFLKFSYAREFSCFFSCSLL